MADTLIKGTSRMRMAQYRDRWSSLGLNPSIAEISEKKGGAQLAKYELFADFPEKFLEKISPDVAVVTWKPGAVLFEEGNFIDLAFFVVSGKVEITLAGGAPLNHGVEKKKEEPETPSNITMLNMVTLSKNATMRSSNKEIRMLSNMDLDLPKNTGVVLGSGELFGELGALSGWAQPVTAKTAEKTVLIQIRLPALRLMKTKSSLLKDRLDRLYRERMLLAQLRSTPLLEGLDESYLQELREKVALISLSPGEQVARQGEPMDALFLVRSGFMKITRHFGKGELVVNYLSKGKTFGAELLLSELQGWESTASAVEYAELIRIDAPVCAEILRKNPAIEERLWREAARGIEEAGYSTRHLNHAQFTENVLDLGLVQGTSILVIDLNTCTRCDDCVRGCAATHGGTPRFVREGNRLGNLLIPKSCFHCHDPVCLVGCPTGAIHRGDTQHETIKIDGDICIGCATCSNNCPYDAIVMHDKQETWPADMLPIGLRGTPRFQASKCDLCKDTGHEPACVSNCPQGCATRVTSLSQLDDMLEVE